MITNLQRMLLAAFVLFYVQISYAQRSNCGASPYPLTVVQPDGSQLNIITRGTEMLNYKETEDGYTVLINPQGVYEYALLDPQGNLQLSGVKAKNNINSAAIGKRLFEKHLRFSAVQIATIKSDFEAMNAEAMRLQKTVEVSYPVSGNIRIIALCMQFPDEPAIYPISAISDLMNQTNYGNTGSFKDYFIANSYGKLIPQVDVFGWYTTTLNRESYGRTLNNGNNNPSYMTNVRSLIAQAIDSADIKSNVDFTLYDNDNNGDVEGIIVFHAGYGAEQGSNGYIWSHRSSLSGSSVRTKDGKSIRNYCINPTKRNWQGDIRMVGLGVLTHEFGHIMGLPDLYDTDNTSEGIGNFGLMGGCGWLNQERTPCQFEVWSKDQFGWITPIVISNPGEYNLAHTLDTAKAFRINTPRSNEYFLLENRQQKGWDRFMPSRGLAIWHINTQRTNLYPGSNTVNADTAIYGVGLEQADGLRNLELGTNRGDAGDLFPGSTNNRIFSDDTRPSSRLHYKIGGVSQPSNVTISNITLNADSTITFRIGLASTAAFTTSVENGCAPFTTTLSNKSTSYASFKWYLPVDVTDMNAENITLTIPNPGQYTVALVIYDSNNVVLDSAVQQINVYESPKATFEYTQVGNRITLKKTSTGLAYHQWKIGTNSQSSLDSVTLTVPPAGLNFYLLAVNSQGCTDTAFGSAVPFATGVGELSAIQRLEAFPNPFVNEVKIAYSLAVNQNVSIRISNLLGATVFETKSEQAASGNHYLTIPLDENIPNGILLVTLITEQGTKTIRVTKLR